MSSIKYKYNIGDVITSNNRNLQIIDREIREVERRHRADNKPFKQRLKFYKYHCNNCGNEDWIKECYLDDTKYFTGCNVCCKTAEKVLKGVNDVATTAPWMVPYFVNPIGCQSYLIDKARLSIRITAPYSEERRKAASERAKQTRISYH